MSDNYLSDNYITNNIFIRDNKLYYKIKKEIKITSNNWHKYLHEYGWYKLHLKWIKRLNEFRVDKKSKNSQFGVLDCGGSGDCFFSCVNSVAADSHKQTGNLSLGKTVISMSSQLSEM